MTSHQADDLCVPLSNKELADLGVVVDHASPSAHKTSTPPKKEFRNLFSSLLETKLDDTFWERLPFSLLQTQVPKASFEVLLRLATREPLPSDDERKKFYQALSLFCFKNKGKLPLPLVKKMHESSWGHSMFDFFKHTSLPEDVDYFLSQGIQHDLPLFKMLAIATLNKDPLAQQISDQVRLVFDQKDLLVLLAPKLTNPNTLRLWFENGMLAKTEATSPQLIGPYMIKSYDTMLDVLHSVAQEDFLPALLGLHQQKLSFTLPYIHRNFDKFQDNKYLWNLREATNHKWVNSVAQEELHVDEFVSLVEKHLLHQEIAQHPTSRPAPVSRTKKM